MSDLDFKKKYGPWAFVAGGSMGIGSAYCDDLARKGINIVLSARRLEPLEKKAEELRDRYDVEVRIVQADLADADLIQHVREKTDDIDVGLLILNAALASINPFLEKEIDEELQKIDINVRATTLMAHHFAKRMVAQKRGGIIIMSSGAGLVGAPYAAVYSATKAYEIAFAEALWGELKDQGVDVMCCVAGLTRTPEIASNYPDLKGYMEPEDVASEALQKLGTRPVMSPGKNKFFAFIMTRLLPKKIAIANLAKHHQDTFL
jgi:short-subunit dehydrogenase